MKGIQCSHGAVTPSSSNKDVDLFMSDFIDSIRQQDFELSNLMRELLIKHPAVFNSTQGIRIWYPFQNGDLNPPVTQIEGVSEGVCSNFKVVT